MNPQPNTPPHAAAQRAFHSRPRAEAVGVAPGDELVLPLHQRIVAQYGREASGRTELRLYCGDKEISFDEPELFAFGERLAAQSHFIAEAAVDWADGLDWARVQPLLTQLVDQGVLQHAADAAPEDPAAARGGERPSPLPAATCTAPRSWLDCEAITAELAGRPLELGWLELVVPVFRVAHLALDADGRQVGEANVFPPALRRDVPTRWRSCIYPGTRFQVERPMNVSALKAMRQHWPAMMAVLRHVRAAYLQRFPEATQRWTVGHLERVSVAVLAVVTWPLMRAERRVPNGELHPALSSVFRVTDGLRMTMHQMLFVPIGEPALPPDAPVTSRAILDYAERNHSFHSEHGVCAGPRSMIEEFLAVMVDGALADAATAAPLPAAVQQALDEVEPALDYALLGLQAHAAVFSLWPVMARCYERLLGIAEPWAALGGAEVLALRDRLRGHRDQLRQASYLGSEQWRVDREAVYADMHRQCGRGLGAAADAPSLSALIAPRRSRRRAAVEYRLAGLLRQRFGSAAAADPVDAPHLTAMGEALMEFLLQLQAIVRTACALQWRINRHLGRTPPQRRFSAADIDIHNRLQGAASRRLPFIVDELEQLLQVRLSIDTETIEIHEAHSDVPAPAGHRPPSDGTGPLEPQRASRT